MRQLTVILLLAFSLLLIGGCKNNEAVDLQDETETMNTNDETLELEKNKEDSIEELVSQLKNFEIVVLEENDENYHITIEYPKFNYEPLDEILSDKQNEFEGQVEQAKSFTSDGMEEFYGYELLVEDVAITENIISIYFEGRFSHSTSGFDLSSSINYDLQNNRVLTLDDVLIEHSISLEEIAHLVAEKLMTDERFLEYYPNPEQVIDNVKKETRPIEHNYSTFTLSDESITFYNQYFSLFPNSEEIIDIEITWDELEQFKAEISSKSDYESFHGRWIYEFGDAVTPSNSLKYEDEDYRFSVELPESWKGKYFVQITKSNFKHLPKGPSKSIVFNMVDDGKYMGYIFSIEVLEGISEAEVREFYQNWPGFEGFAGAGNDVVLIYARPGEMEAALYEEPYIEVGNEFSKMVEEDMPKILETLQFY